MTRWWDYPQYNWQQLCSKRYADLLRLEMRVSGEVQEEESPESYLELIQKAIKFREVRMTEDAIDAAWAEVA